MNRAVLLMLCVVYLLALPAWGVYYLDGYTVDPPNPVARQDVCINLYGSWSDSCTPNRTEVLVDGNNIHLVYYDTQPFRYCLTVLTEWNPTFHIRGLPAGTYDVYTAYSEASLFLNGPVHEFNYLTTIVVSPIGVIGDVDNDGTVNVFDVFVLAEAWNTRAGDPNFNPACDLDADGAVNVFDVFVLAENWNRTLQP